MPSSPEPRPDTYELEAEEYLRSLLQCEDEVEDFRSQAEGKNQPLWKTEEESTATSLFFRHEIRCLAERVRNVRRELEQSETREAKIRREAMGRSARIEADAHSQIQQACRDTML